MAFWYTIRSGKRRIFEPELPWKNTAEVFSASAIVDEQAQGGMAAWRVFERALTFDLIEFHEATMSSWRQEEPSEVPPDELFQYAGPVQAGLRSAPAAPAPLDDTLFINRMPYSGNRGKLYLRGCIDEQQLQITARARVLTAGARVTLGDLVETAAAALSQNLLEFGLTLGMVSHPRIGWEQVPTAPGKKPKFKPIYDKTVLYERSLKGLRLNGTKPLQLKQH